MPLQSKVAEVPVNESGEEDCFVRKLNSALPGDLLKVLPPFIIGQDPVEYLLGLLKEITRVGDDGILWVHEISPGDVDGMSRSRMLAYLQHIEPNIEWGKYQEDHKLRKSLHRLLHTHFRGNDE